MCLYHCEPLPLSALQHYAFCPRQCALIHVERRWEDNRLTAEGNLFHERVHQKETESRADTLVVRGLRLRSERLGLVGQSDVVEFHRTSETGTVLRGRNGFWKPFPVEYKRGRPKKDGSDATQLCAQAMCLEEMLDTRIPEGALFYGKTRRRQNVVFDDAIRLSTETVAEKVHDLIGTRATPEPVNDSRCKNCSLASLCMPTAGKARGYINRRITRILEEV